MVMWCLKVLHGWPDGTMANTVASPLEGCGFDSNLGSFCVEFAKPWVQDGKWIVGCSSCRVCMHNIKWKVTQMLYQCFVWLRHVCSVFKCSLTLFLYNTSFVRLPSRRTVAWMSLHQNMARLTSTMLLTLGGTSGQEAQVTTLPYWSGNLQK